MAKKDIGGHWRDKIRNEDVRKRTPMEKLEGMLKKTRVYAGWVIYIEQRKNYEAGTRLDAVGMETKTREAEKDLAKHDYARSGRRRNDMGRGSDGCGGQSDVERLCRPMRYQRVEGLRGSKVVIMRLLWLL